MKKEFLLFLIIFTLIFIIFPVFSQTVTEKNIAIEAKAHWVSGVYSPEYASSYAIDGNETTVWGSQISGLVYLMFT